MPTSTSLISTAAAAVGISSLLYGPIVNFASTTLGSGRVLQPAADFPYTCRKVSHPSLQACEDAWIDQAGRTVYAACSSLENRKAWQPSVDNLNQSGRLGMDHFSAFSLDEDPTDGFSSLRVLTTNGYTSWNGLSALDLHGFDVDPLSNDRLRFWVVNHQPWDDCTEEGRNGINSLGANSTVEVFDNVRGSDVLEHRATYYHELIVTPNRVAGTGRGGFMVTNDRSTKVGRRRSLEGIVPGGFVAHCRYEGRDHTSKPINSRGNTCVRASPPMNLPNGIVRSHLDKLYYVPGTASGIIHVFAEKAYGYDLEQVDMIETGYPLDNLSVDADGVVWAAAFPKLRRTMAVMKDPMNPTRCSPSTVLRITNIETRGGWPARYHVSKVWEDRDCEAMSGMTTVVHDAATGKLVMVGIFTPYITVCQRT